MKNEWRLPAWLRGKTWQEMKPSTKAEMKEAYRLIDKMLEEEGFLGRKRPKRRNRRKKAAK